MAQSVFQKRNLHVAFSFESALTWMTQYKDRRRKYHIDDLLDSTLNTGQCT